MLPRKYCLVGVHFSLTRRMANFRCTRWRYLFARWQPKIECVALCILDRSATKSSIFLFWRLVWSNWSFFVFEDPTTSGPITAWPTSIRRAAWAVVTTSQVEFHHDPIPIDPYNCMYTEYHYIYIEYIYNIHAHGDIYIYGDSENYISMCTPSFFIFATAHRIWGFHHHHAASQW